MCTQLWQVLERTVAELQERLNLNADNPQMGVVRLSGLVHADELAAFQEIARQLCMCVPMPERLCSGYEAEDCLRGPWAAHACNSHVG